MSFNMNILIQSLIGISLLLIVSSAPRGRINPTTTTTTTTTTAKPVNKHLENITLPETFQYPKNFESLGKEFRKIFLIEIFFVFCID